MHGEWGEVYPRGDPGAGNNRLIELNTSQSGPYVPEGSTIKRSMAKEYIEERDGNFYVAGTRISLDSIVHAFRRGESPETICQNFKLLRLEEVYGAIAYYLGNQADIDSYMIRQNDKWAEGRRNAEPLPANLRDRLMRARDELHTTRLS